jgi:hypothetical protein
LDRPEKLSQRLDAGATLSPEEAEAIFKNMSKGQFRAVLMINRWTARTMGIDVQAPG